MGVVFGPLRPFAALCRCAHCRASARGQVAPGTVSGPRSRGTRCGPRREASSTPSKRAKEPGHREWGLPPVPRTTCPGTSAAPLLVAGHRQLLQGGGGAPGRRLHSRCHGSFARLECVMTRLAVAGRGGAPRAWAGERGRRHRPGAQSLGAGPARTDRLSLEAPGHLPSRAGWHARTSERPQKGRPRIPILLSFPTPQAGKAFPKKHYFSQRRVRSAARLKYRQRSRPVRLQGGPLEALEKPKRP